MVNLCIKQRHWKAATAELTRLLLEVRAVRAVAAPCTLTGLQRAEVLLQCRLARLSLHQVRASALSRHHAPLFQSLPQPRTLTPPSPLRTLACTQGCLKKGIAHCDAAMDLVSAAGLAQDAVAAQVHLTRGLALFSIHDYEEAARLFSDVARQSEEGEQQAAGAEGAAVSVVPPALVQRYAGVVFGEDALYGSAVNGYAICALQLKDITGSVRQMEQLLLRAPVKYMSDIAVFNLCTLYDLSCCPALCAKKKKVLQLLAARYGVTAALNPKSYRL